MADELLFSYGTLQLEAVQLSTFGRVLNGEPDTLPGFSRSLVAIDDPGVVALSGEAEHPIVRHTGRPEDVVEGAVFVLTPEEIQNADKYEVSAYRRISVRLGSGRQAWVYIDARHAPP
jgi:hypothetical protein